MKIRLGLGYLFLLFQVILIFYSRYIPERFFCWAPYDEQTSYEILVTIDGKKLSEDEVGKRYRYGQKRMESRTVHNVFNMVKQYEETYGKHDNAQVEIIYSTNGGQNNTWNFPH